MTKRAETNRSNRLSDRKVGNGRPANDNDLRKAVEDTLHSTWLQSGAATREDGPATDIVVASLKLLKELDAMNPGHVALRIAHGRLVAAVEAACLVASEEVAAGSTGFVFRLLRNDEEVEAAAAIAAEAAEAAAVMLTVRGAYFDGGVLDSLFEGYLDHCKQFDRLPGVELRLTAVYSRRSPEGWRIVVCDPEHTEFFRTAV